jgi:hypothetical protein
MRRLIPLVLAPLALRSASPFTAPANRLDEQLALTALAPGDQLRVSLHFHGCFHDVWAGLSLDGNEHDGARVTGSVTGNYSREIERVIDRALDRRQLADLDAWLAYYRDLPSNVVCTSVTELDLELYHNGRLVRREHYRDDTCGGFDPPALPETSFTTLIEPQ